MNLDANSYGCIAAMAGFALATSASPGPVNIVSAMSGARFGAARTIPYVLGATAGFVSILALIGTGLGSLMTDHPIVELALGLIGALYMLHLAFAIARASMLNMNRNADSIAPPSLMSGFLAQYLNPKAWLVSVSAVSIYVAANRDYLAALVTLCTIFFVICFPSLLTWSYIGAAFSRKPKAIRLFNVVMATVLALSVAAFLYDLLATRAHVQ
jgi:threonine/homoserine/homoserine lactone efflux protein